jgi:transposase InsO family protein
MAESFNGAIKNELIYRTAYPTRKRASTAIAQYIEVFYNRQRLHSGLRVKSSTNWAGSSQRRNTISDCPKTPGLSPVGWQAMNAATLTSSPP